MSIQIDFQEKPSQGGPDQTACSTPNPPWWCNDAPDANIDMGIELLIGMGLIIGMVVLYLKRKK